VFSLKSPFDESMKSFSQNKLDVNSLGAPTSRKDAAELLEWMDSQIEHIVKSKDDSRVEKIEATQNIYNFVIYTFNSLGMERAHSPSECAMC